MLVYSHRLGFFALEFHGLWCLVIGTSADGAEVYNSHCWKPTGVVRIRLIWNVCRSVSDDLFIFRSALRINQISRALY
ncbi:MAG: hypothetical protein BECKG1743D_GA0114223_109723 [Candidatus Kentron sp. G]|nr:MAG: hypothetical protein BECKG1743F_GA0114225_109791 [Candidatus Kentron sp. G]VFN07063.1 MAG: hypothetical protein BECKG1743D_GA0114223_109723 [Candidatus Kentron sp. G]